MSQLFRNDAAMSEWLSSKWLPRKAARAQELRQYVEETWPELDWRSAHEHYRAAAEQNGGAAPHRATAAHEALARCVAAAESALFYRSVARWCDDPRLRGMAREMALEEAQSFTCFRAAFDRAAPALGLIEAWRTTRACVRSARDTGLRLAFEAVAAHCGLNAPFPTLDYCEFLQRMRSVIERCARPGLPERILFQPWSRAPAPRVEAKKPLLQGFRPVLAQAA
jgi:hypothetical protein